MNYEKLYKDALERARDLTTRQTPPAFDKDLISLVFPELRESEGEKMRKNLYKCLRYYVPNDIAEEYIAWLEKQGEQTHTELVESENERIRQGLINGFNECLKDCPYPQNAVKYWHGIDINQILTWLEKQGKKNIKEIKD